jgi:hypothetical protein
MAPIAAEERVMSNPDTDRPQPSRNNHYPFAERTPARGSNGLISALVALAVLGAVVVVAIKNNPAKVDPAPVAHHASATMTKTDTASEDPTTPASTGSAQQVTGAIVAAL